MVLALTMTVTSVPSQASQFGCQVLLCMSNPASNGGPRGVHECVAIIDKFFRDLQLGRPFPTCDRSDGNSNDSQVRMTHDDYESCPTGTSVSTPGNWVAQGYLLNDGSAMLSSTPAASEPYKYDRDAALGQRACVGTSQGNYITRSDDSSQLVYLYDRVVWQQPSPSTYMEIYNDGVLVQRIKM